MSSRPKHSSSSKGSSSKDSGHKSSGHKKEHRSKQKGNSLQSSQLLYTPAATPTQDYYVPEDGATTSYGNSYGNANDAYIYDQAAVPNKQWYCVCFRYHGWHLIFCAS